MKKTIQRECSKHGLTDFVFENRGAYRCKQCRMDNVTKKRRDIKMKLTHEFGGKCQLCGYDRYVGNLTFHHRDANQKDFGISKMSTRSFERLREEAKKCVLLCCRCHGEVHAGLVSIPE